MPHSLESGAIQRYTCFKHHISPCSSADTIHQAARNLVGLHSARLPSPFVTLHARIPSFKPNHLHDAILREREVIKLRCMRRTLHTVPLDLAPIVHQATLSFRRAECLRSYARLGASSLAIGETEEAVLACLADGPASSRVIEQRVGASSPPRAERGKAPLPLVRTAIKHLWETGVLCYLNVSSTWGSEERRYGLTAAFYPGLNLNSIDPSEAQQKLVYSHIERYGPVSVKDIVWWSGLSVRAIQQALNSVKAELIEVRVEGYNSKFYMTRSDYEAFRTFRPCGMSWVKFLAYEDPSLKGYFESRERYVRDEHYDQLFNQIGEARPSIMADGRIIGVWSWDKRQRRVDWRVFAKSSQELRGMIEAAAQQTNAFLQ